MFYFFHSAQNAENVNYYKGVLFEQLLKRYLDALGFEIELRQKRSSLEYDLVGRAKLDGRTLVGEAKAHGKPVTGEVFTSFVGKLYPLHEEGSADCGLFVSTSSLSPEADDYRREKLSKTKLRVIVLTGESLLSDIIERLNLPRPETLSSAAARSGLYPLSHHLLTTESGTFVLQIDAIEGGATPAAFTIFRSDGSLVTDLAFVGQVRQHVQVLSELTPITTPNATPNRSLRGSMLKGLILGSEWADYRLPAPPAFFVGRTVIVERLIAALNQPTAPAVVQIKSRSGVGKSSLMSVVADKLTAAGCEVHLYDARNIKSVLDLWSVIQAVTNSPSPASDLAQMQTQVARLRDCSAPVVLMIDQFESTFGLEDLFDAYELIALSAAQIRSGLKVIFARKSDLLTTYDDSQVSLERLNQLSQSFVLEDFDATEAVELISRISEHSDFQISPEVKTYVLEFAQGFPWLLKRTMAHVLKLLREGTPQAELIPSALRLDDLFNEELEELDEIERSYLVRLAQRAPATYQELERYFDEDPNLSSVLEKLTRDRLLRLSGTTYDTYNDVFKEYLVYRRLPEFRVSFVYRQNPGSVLSAFRKATELGRFTTEQFSAEFNKARGTTFNLIRELRNHGLVDREGVGWVVPEAVLDALDRTRLGDYVRQQLLRNGLVTDLISHLQAGNTLSSAQLPLYLRQRFPFVAASTNTWADYAGTLLSWLKLVRLVSEADGEIGISREDRATTAREIGNLKQRYTGVRVSRKYFLPAAFWSHVEALYSQGPALTVSRLTTKQKDAFRSLVELGCATSSGQLKHANLEELKRSVRVLFEAEPYKKFWSAAALGDDLNTILIEDFQLRGLEPSTLHWRKRLLTNWGRAVGVLTRSRVRTSPHDPFLPFETGFV